MPLPAAAEVRPEREEGEKSTREKISPACFAASSPSLPPKPEQRTRERALSLIVPAGGGGGGRERGRRRWEQPNPGVYLWLSPAMQSEEEKGPFYSASSSSAAGK